MPRCIDGIEFHSAGEVAHAVGIHRQTLLRWIREGKVLDVARDPNGWRVFSQEDLDRVRDYTHTLNGNGACGQETQTPRLNDGVEFHSTSEVAHAVGIHRQTLLKWIREGKILDVARDRNGWRVFSQDDLNRVRHYAHTLNGNGMQAGNSHAPMH